MEIFVGTYMRRWFYPCESTRAPPESVETGSFAVLSLFRGFSILNYSTKRHTSFCWCPILLLTDEFCSHIRRITLITSLFARTASYEKRFLNEFLPIYTIFPVLKQPL